MDRNEKTPEHDIDLESKIYIRYFDSENIEEISNSTIKISQTMLTGGTEALEIAKLPDEDYVLCVKYSAHGWDGGSDIQIFITGHVSANDRSLAKTVMREINEETLFNIDEKNITEILTVKNKKNTTSWFVCNVKDMFIDDDIYHDVVTVDSSTHKVAAIIHGTLSDMSIKIKMLSKYNIGFMSSDNIIALVCMSARDVKKMIPMCYKIQKHNSRGKRRNIVARVE